jgi:uncharacterized protein YndB with AHSA1/START domain
MLEVKNSISINAKADIVWDWLINPIKTKQYMFGCEALTNWEIGSQLDWKMIHEGAELIPVTGIVKEFKPSTRLAYTVIDPFAAYENIPENQLNVIYEIEESNEGCRLTVIQNGFEGAADGMKRFTEVSNEGDGWNPILKLIKQLVEA